MINGTCSSRFERVGEVFAENFAKRGEVGAAVCVYENGVKLVDLWGGVADPQTGMMWEQNTLVCMMSVGKGMSALCVHRLIDRGAIDLHAPVAQYWPEFAQAGKGAITVKQLLGGLAGLIYADAAPPNSIMNWKVMVGALEQQAPEWPPGTKGAYHSMSMGFLMGELVRRVDGRPIDQFFREEIAQRLDVEYGYGLNDEQIARTARIIPNPESVTANAIKDRASKLGRAWKARPAGSEYYSTDEFRRGVLPSSNGHGNARSVARIYAALSLDGTIDGVEILKPGSIERLREEQWDGICGMTDRHFRYGQGFFLGGLPLAPLGPNRQAFGHPGAGGALGFADPESKIAFSYSPNFMCGGAGVGDRCEALVQAVFA
ncbi:serine hydrolase domain-containing protein [Roseiterribacter gracilis]|uniref:Serine hydrolase n=1 Tax=Roseiterribacter gracilis TaxID=2812848 RepID=A0A8S8X5Q0_9PROT|nr:serine hydrolase [Rhodospirillales bacterium TMPK1]